MNCNKNKCSTNQAGKGDRPRNCFSKKFKDNYDLIDWGEKKEENNIHKKKNN